MVLAPLATVAFWGASYLLDCVRTIEAPGVPIEFSLHTNAGDLTLSAASYSISPMRGAVYITRPKLQAPDGTVLAQLDTLEVTGVRILEGGHQTLKIRGSNLSGHVERRSDGKFDFEDFIPARGATESQISFDVDISHSEVDFVDKTGRDAWSSTLGCPHMTVAGVGQDWVASGRFSASGVGSVDLDLHNNSQDGMTVSGSTESAQLASVGAHFLRSPSLAGVAALREASTASLVGSGPFLVRVPRKGAPTVRAQISVTAVGIKWEKFSAQQGHFRGEITEEGAKGEVVLVDGNTTASFNGSTRWKNGFVAAGQTSFEAPDAGALPPWASSFVPQSAQFRDGSFHGWLSYTAAREYHLSGELRASEVRHDSLAVSGARANVEAENSRVVVDLTGGQLQGQPISAIVEINPQAKSLNGTVSADRVDLSGLVQQFGRHEVAGEASVAALISGTTQKPRVDFQASGQGIASLPGDHTISLGHFELSGLYSSGLINLNRAMFNTPEGVVQAQGTVDPNGELRANVVGRGMLAAAYDPRFSGSLNLSAKVTGSIKQPRAAGRIEGYDLSYKNKIVPAVVADFKADRLQVQLEQVEAARGTASLVGEGSIQLKDKTLHASFSARDIQLAEWLNDSFVGAVDVPEATVGGTLDHPSATAKVDGTNLVVDGIKVDKASASLSLLDHIVAINDGVVHGADGSSSIQGKYNLDQGAGAIQITVDGLSIERILPAFTDSVFAQGTLSGSASLALEGGHLTHSGGSGTFNGVTLNGTSIGDGAWDLKSTDSILHGQLKLGDAEHFVRVTNLSFDPELKKGAADVLIKGIQAKNLIDTASRYFADLSPDAQDAISSVEGALALDGHFEGTLHDPSIQVKSLQLSNLSVRKVPLGEFNSSFDLSRHKWTVAQASLSKGPAAVTVHGTIEEQGQMHLDGTNDNRFDLGQLSALDARISRLTGTAHLWFTADGPTRSPRIVASLNLDNLFAPPGVTLGEEHDDRYLRVEFDRIILDPTSSGGSGADLTGAYFYKGFQGSISAQAPFDLPFTIPEGKPVSASVTFDKSDLKGIAELLGGIDPTRTSGTASGRIDISGKAEELKVSGAIGLQADTLAFNGLDDVIHNSALNLKLTDKALTLDASGNPIRGGTLNAAASVPFTSIQEIFDTVKKGGAIALLDRAFSGSVTTSEVQIRQRFLGQSTVAVTSDAHLAIGGTLKHPAISGSVALGSADVVAKAVTDKYKFPQETAVNPEFNIDFRLTDPARLRSSTADMYLSGDGKLSGSLLRPKADASLVVERGTVRLPAALLRLEQGGTVKVGYGNAGAGVATAIVDMEGTTSVTATRYADTDVQRYDITLGFKGDLLQDNGLTLTATSDPGDLSQDRILAILGQADLLQTLSNGGKESSAIQNAFLSTVPMLLDPYTGQVARGLGLDFISVEYNSYDYASVAFGKVLGSGFSVEGSRQLSEPPPGFTSRYDIRLLYRPKRLFGALSRVRFYVGSDQDREWKLGLEYGIRF